MAKTDKIIGQLCTNCQTKIFPRRSFCPNCRKTKFSDWEVPTEGVIYSFTTVNFPLDKYESPPYLVGLISVNEDEKNIVTARLKQNQIKIGQKVKLEVGTFPETKDLKILIATPI